MQNRRVKEDNHHHRKKRKKVEKTYEGSISDNVSLSWGDHEESITETTDSLSLPWESFYLFPKKRRGEAFGMLLFPNKDIGSMILQYAQKDGYSSTTALLQTSWNTRIAALELEKEKYSNSSFVEQEEQRRANDRQHSR